MGFPLRPIATGIAKILGWKFSGLSWPQPYFDKGAQTPKHPFTVLQPEERDALRLKCGPKPRCKTSFSRSRANLRDNPYHGTDLGVQRDGARERPKTSGAQLGLA
jgi:hypothetical protein